MELIVPSLQTTAGVDEISLQKQQQEEGKSQSVPKSANNKRAVVWPEFKVPLPDPVRGKFDFAYWVEDCEDLCSLQTWI